jgi:hypothetical protein
MPNYFPKKAARDDTRDVLNQVINYLKNKGKLDDNDLSELSEIIGSNKTMDDGSEPHQSIINGLQQLDQARKETASVTGGTNGDNYAHDTAAKVYRHALGLMGVDPKGVFDTAGLRTLFRTVKDRRHASGAPMLAMDQRSADSLAERFPHAAKIGRHYLG